MQWPLIPLPQILLLLELSCKRCLSWAVFPNTDRLIHCNPLAFNGVQRGLVGLFFVNELWFVVEFWLDKIRN